MTVYRFRVSFEDHSDIYRDIEILSNQSFEDLHDAIQQAIGFDASKNATFFQSNDYWRREKEIPLQIQIENSEKKGKSKTKKTYLCDYIDDPHQKLIYYFDFDKVENAVWTFTVELIKLSPEDHASFYPRTVKTQGVAIRQYKVQKFVPSSEDDEDEKPKSKSKKVIVDKIFDEDDFAGATLVKDDDDLADGFGEEGEEIVEEEEDAVLDDGEKTEGEDEDDMLEDSPEDEFEQLDENMEE